MIKFIDFGDDDMYMSHNMMYCRWQEKELNEWKSKYEGATKKPSLCLYNLRDGDERHGMYSAYVKSNDFPELPIIILESVFLYESNAYAVSIYPLIGNSIRKAMNLDIFIDLFNDGIIDGFNPKPMVAQFNPIHNSTVPFVVLSDNESNGKPYMPEYYYDLIDNYNKSDKVYAIIFSKTLNEECLQLAYNRTTGEKAPILDLRTEDFVYNNLTDAYTKYEELKAMNPDDGYTDIDIMSLIKKSSGMYEPTCSWGRA